AAFLIAAPDREMKRIILGISGGLALGWLALALALARVMLVTVRTTGEGLVARYPWGNSRTLRWQLVDRVDRQLNFLRLHSIDNSRLLVFQSALEGGERLERMILLRVSPTVLSQPLQQELAMMGGGIFTTQPSPQTPRLTLAPIWSFLA